MRDRTLLVEVANTDGELDRLKNRKRSRRRSRTVDLMNPVSDLAAWRDVDGDRAEGGLLFRHANHGGLWTREQ